jgi:hypothetical protein
MSRLKSLLLFTVMASSLIISCNNNEIGDSEDVNPDAIYFDYRVWGDEENGDITVKLQYRFAGPSGTTLVLKDPSKVELDGKVIKADSSKMSGAYYEVIKPVKDFAGKHTIVFTDVNGKEYKEEFSFQPIRLKTKVPAVINRGDIILELNGLAPEDYVNVMLHDTASFSEGINRIDTVKNGSITITKEDLDRLADGPVYLEILKEDEKRVKNGTREGGRLSISYGLKRQFELRAPLNLPLGETCFSQTLIFDSYNCYPFFTITRNFSFTTPVLLRAFCVSSIARHAK